MKIQRPAAKPICRSRWLGYATASAATALGAGHAAEAAIHYSGPINLRFPGYRNLRSSFPLDRPGDSLIFEHLQTVFGFTQTHFAGFKAVGRESASMRGLSSESYAKLSNLNPGSFVSQGHFRLGYGNLSGFGTLTGPFGGYFHRGIAYVGFAFNGGSGQQYGWARLLMAGRFHRGSALKLLDYAFADPGEPIQVGQESDSPVSGMGSLGWLAAGAVGLVAWRGQRRRVA